MNDLLREEEIKANLKTKAFGKTLQIFPELPSTMDTAKALGLTGAPEGMVVIADAQTHGRGRHSRTWFSPAGKNIYCSILFRSEFAPEETQRLLCLVLVAARQMISDDCGIEAKIKWPNDLVVNGKKIAGFLLQNEIEGSRLLFSILGVGININLEKKDLPPELVGLASSLKIETGQVFPRSKLIASLFNQIEDWYRILNEEGFKKIKDAWISNWQELNKPIKIHQPGRTYEGLGVDLDDCGYIIVKLEDGKRETIFVGEPV